MLTAGNQQMVFYLICIEDNTKMRSYRSYPVLPLVAGSCRGNSLLLFTSNQVLPFSEYS